MTRFVTRDALPLMKRPRDAFVERWGTYEEEPDDTIQERIDKRTKSIGGKPTNIVMASLAYLWECDWCASIWIGSLVTYLTWRWTDTMVWILVALVASSVTGTWALVEKKLSADR